MSKRRNSSMPAAVGAVDEHQPPPLKKQNRYSCEPWKPGEVPLGMIFTTRPGGRPATSPNVAPWCSDPQRNGVQAPMARGKRGPEKL